MKIVLDTNVLISGLMLPDSVPGRIVRAWRAAKFDLVLSEPMLEEIERVLAYRKIQTRIGWDEDTIQRFVLLLRFKSQVVDITAVFLRRCQTTLPTRRYWLLSSPAMRSAW